MTDWHHELTSGRCAGVSPGMALSDVLDVLGPPMHDGFSGRRKRRRVLEYGPVDQRRSWLTIWFFQDVVSLVELRLDVEDSGGGQTVAGLDWVGEVPRDAADVLLHLADNIASHVPESEYSAGSIVVATPQGAPEVHLETMEGQVLQIQYVPAARRAV